MSQGEWQRPEGVTKGNWDYIRSKPVASDYDDFLGNDDLMRLDQEVVQRSIGTAPQHIVGFGCGTGRTLLQLAALGHHVTGVDLSGEMLSRFEAKAKHADRLPNCNFLKANLVDLAGIRSEAFDHAVCLFSTLGMIHGQENRSEFLQHANRTLKPGGQFVVHAHSSLHQLNQRGGWKWGLQSLFSKREFGDRYASYRGINDFFIHSFRRGELERELADAGFECLEWNEVLPGKESSRLRTVAAGSSSRFTSGFKTVGWIVVATRN